MKPLFVLLGVFVISLVITKIAHRKWQPALSGRIAISIMLLFTAMAHFAFTKGMSLMLPAFIPYKVEIVYLTGIIEIIAAIGIVIPGFRLITAWLLIAFFILIIPANITAAIKQVNYQKGTYDGSGLTYLWFRIPLQLLFVAWTYLSAIKKW